MGIAANTSPLICSTIRGAKPIRTVRFIGIEIILPFEIFLQKKWLARIIRRIGIHANAAIHEPISDKGRCNREANTDKRIRDDSTKAGEKRSTGDRRASYRIDSL